LKTTKAIFFILFVALIIWPASYFFHARQTLDPHEEKIVQIVQGDEFLMGLHNKPSQGCVALKYMPDVDTIIIGSSRAYASIDNYALKEELGGQRVGICALSSWNTDFLHEFMTFLEKENISPNRLIWIADSAVPLRLGLHEKRLDYAKAVFNNPELQSKMIDKWTENHDSGLPILGLTKEAYENQKTFHSQQINNLSLDTVKARLDKFETVATGNLSKVVASAKINPLNAKNLNKFCTDLKLQGIDLNIVLSPIPEKVAKIVSQNETAMGLSSTVDFFDVNAPCASKVIDQPLQGWGLDERHFMNRNLKDDYPYEIWNDEQEFGAHYTNMSPRLQPRFYSPDHLNAIGALIFTEKLAPMLKE